MRYIKDFFQKKKRHADIPENMAGAGSNLPIAQKES
jgi:hypothetical protein